MPIDQIIDLFIAEVCAGKMNETPVAYRSKLARLARWLAAEGLCLDQLTPALIERFKLSLLNQDTKQIGAHIRPGHLSPFTIHTCLRTVKHFLRWCFERGIISVELSRFKIPAPPAPEPKAISQDMVLSLLHAASELGEPWEQARNLAMLYLLRDTGGRIGALLRADVNDLDLAHGKLQVIEKGKKPRTLYLNSPSVIALTEWLRHRPDLDPQEHRLFLSYRGRGLARSSFYGVIRRLLDAGGLTGRGRVNPHAFRHAWARDALEAGEDLTKVSQTLGHSTARVTADYYARWSDGELQAAHRRYSPGADLPVIRPKKKPP
jgi:site-specific recombinase XerD